ncbi:MAG: iron-sulfur cluster assembly scaffold protein [Anaerolineae bacterium]
MVQSPYREHILDHYQNPRHWGRLKDPNLVGEADNPVCGDRVRLELQLDQAERVAEVAFGGKGCVISLAAASMLAEHVHGRGLEELHGLTDRDLLAMLGVNLSRVRTRCALVALEALRAALGGKG